MISYAQNFEDVMISRLFDPNHRGFYIDVGAAHPKFLSVTCHFYKSGWSGVNVEATWKFYSLLCEARPNDVNLHCAIGKDRGRATLFATPGFLENSTLDPNIAAELALSGLPSDPHEVDVINLVELCEKYAAGRVIDFMKIDVEGGELNVLEGGDWERYRPRLLIVEATAVNSKEENWAIWEPILTKARYHKVWFDGLNNFYLREEDIELRSAFRLPPNIFDNIEVAELAELKLLLAEAFEHRSQIQVLDPTKLHASKSEIHIAGLQAALNEEINARQTIQALLNEEINARQSIQAQLTRSNGKLAFYKKIGLGWLANLA